MAGCREHLLVSLKDFFEESAEDVPCGKLIQWSCICKHQSADPRPDTARARGVTLSHNAMRWICS